MELPKTSFDAVQQKKSSLSFEIISIIVLMAIVFLLPLFFASTPFFSFQFSKSFIVSVGVIATLGFFLLSVLRTGTIVFPYHGIILSMLLVLVSTLASSFWSSAPISSLVGYGFEADTFSFFALLILLLLLTVILFRSKENIFYSYLVFFGSFFIISLYHILRFIFGPDFLSFGFFTNIFSNTIGKWNEVAVFFGISAILSLISLELVRLIRPFKILLWIALAVSTFFLAVVNFSLVWTLLAAFSFIFFLYILALTWESSSSGTQRRISWVSLAFLFVSLVFVLGGNVVGNYFSKFIGGTNFEVRPSWSATFDISKSVLKENPVFGSGPNRFLPQWLLYKPEGVNLTNFWNAEFNYGVGIIPTTLITGGILGALAWLAFLGFFIYIGFKSLFFKGGEPFSQYLIISSFLASLYLWSVVFFYVPGITIITLTFFFTGLFLAALAEQKLLPMKTISFLNQPKISFLSVLLIVFLLVGTLSYGYLVVRNGLSSYYFERSVLAFNLGDLDKAESLMVKALLTEKNDTYYRSMSQLNITRLNQIAAREEVPTEAIRADFQRVLGSALDNARQAINADGTNFLNWVTIGRVYQVMVSLKIEGAYENALTSYNEAIKRSPHDPSLYLELARLELVKGDNKKAKDYIAQSLKQKQNYTEAIFLLSQIEVSEGNLNGAISSVESAALLSPDDPLVYFRLGLLKYNKKDYKGGTSAFERAVVLNPIYANARYFLGLSYYQQGKKADAIAQFEIVQSTNPDNEEVKLILKNLKAGKSPFANVTPPLDDAPEKRDKLPVSEDKGKNVEE